MRTAAPLPFVFVNMAMTADGKIASADRRLTTFGSPLDAQHLYQLRATADAILCGARTIEQSHSTLGNGPERFTEARLHAGRQKFPLRVVVSGSGSISTGAELWSRPYGPVIVATTRRASAARLRWFRTQSAAVYQATTNELDWSHFLPWLRVNYGVERILSEGGGELNDGLFRARLVSELHLTWCPLLLGGRRGSTIADGRGSPDLAAAVGFNLIRARRVGDEFFLTYRFLG